MTNPKHDPVAALIDKSRHRVTALTGPDANAEMAQLLASRLDNGVVIAPADRRGMKFLEIPTGADLAWLRGTSAVLLIAPTWSEADLSAAIAVADVVVYAAGDYFYVLKGGVSNHLPFPARALAQ